MNIMKQPAKVSDAQTKQKILPRVTPKKSVKKVPIPKIKYKKKIYDQM